MGEERLRILQMLSDGKINPEEAERLITATEQQRPQSDVSTAVNAMIEGKFLYVLVEPKEGRSSERVSVKVPFALLKAGLNIAGLIPKEAQDKINSSMQEKGMSFNLQDFKPENIKELMDSLEQLSVDIDADDSTVKVFCK